MLVNKARDIKATYYYTYCHNNPLIYDDPTGHFPHILLGVLVVGVLSVAATGITNLVTTGKLGSAKQYVGAFASGFVEGAVGTATLGIGSIAAKVAIDASTSFGSNLIEQKITTGKVSLKKAAVETATGMAISGAASKVAKKFQNSKINQKLTKKLEDVTSSLKSKTKNITTNIAKKTKEATQKTVNTVSDKVKTIANKTLNGTSTSKSVKNKVASAIDSLGEGILNVQNAFAPTYEFAEIGPIKAIKTGFGESGEETLSQFLSKDVKQLKTMFFSQGNKSGSGTVNVPKPGDDNFIGPLIRPEHHFIFGEGIGPKQRGVLGAHNMNYFEQTLTSTGFGLDDLKIGVPVPHPTINGIYSQKYTVPAYDGRGNFIGFKNIKDPKTIYDPTVISNRQMLDWGWEAMENGVVSGRIIEGSASNGLKFRGYIGDDGLVTNFFPIFE